MKEQPSSALDDLEAPFDEPTDTPKRGRPRFNYGSLPRSGGGRSVKPQNGSMKPLPEDKRILDQATPVNEPPRTGGTVMF